MKDFLLNAFEILSYNNVFVSWKGPNVVYISYWSVLVLKNISVVANDFCWKWQVSNFSSISWWKQVTFWWDGNGICIIVSIFRRISHIESMLLWKKNIVYRGTMKTRTPIPWYSRLRKLWSYKNYYNVPYLGLYDVQDFAQILYLVGGVRIINRNNVFHFPRPGNQMSTMFFCLLLSTCKVKYFLNCLDTIPQNIIWKRQ